MLIFHRGSALQCPQMQTKHLGCCFWGCGQIAAGDQSAGAEPRNDADEGHHPPVKQTSSSRLWNLVDKYPLHPLVVGLQANHVPKERKCIRVRRVAILLTSKVSVGIFVRSASTLPGNFMFRAYGRREGEGAHTGAPLCSHLSSPHVCLRLGRMSLHLPSRERPPSHQVRAPSPLRSGVVVRAPASPHLSVCHSASLPVHFLQ